MTTYKFSALTILKSAHTKIKDFKSIRISTYKKRGEGANIPSLTTVADVTETIPDSPRQQFRSRG
jgi:hypothetical protein